VDIDHSETTAWKQCRQRHYFQYILKLEPKKPQLELLLGTAVHYALERFHGYGEDILLAFDVAFNTAYADLQTGYVLNEREVQELANLNLLGDAMLQHYHKQWVASPDFTYVVSEFAFRVPIPGTGGFFKGRTDGIVQDTYGDYWVIEHKTATTFPSPEYFALDEQSLKYQWALQQIISSGGIEAIPQDAILKGWCYNGLLKAVPQRPPLLKSGEKLSVAKIKTTYDVYLDTINTHGFSPDDYQGILEQLAQQEDVFFLRKWFRRTRHELREIEQRLQVEYVEMKNGSFVYPSPSKLCPKYPYYEPCLETQRGGDVKFILKHMYREKSHRGEVTV